jgi:hypothetical protein
MPLAIQKRGGIRSNNTTVIVNEHGQTVCTLHRTRIATFDPRTDSAVLNTGGYNTPTTIRRMNECLTAWGFSRRVCKADFAASNTRHVGRSATSLMGV